MQEIQNTENKSLEEVSAEAEAQQAKNLKELLEKLKKKIGEEKGAETYSEELVLLYHQSYPLLVLESLGKFVQQSSDDRLKAIDDIPEYLKIKQTYQKTLLQKMALGFKTLIMDNRADTQTFVKSDKKWKAESAEVAREEKATKNQLNALDPLNRADKPLTTELVKEVVKHQSEILNNIYNKQLFKQFGKITEVQDWVADKIFLKYGVYVKTNAFGQALDEGVKKDEELKAIFDRLNGLIMRVVVQFKPPGLG